MANIDHTVLSHYPGDCRSHDARFLGGAGGFSGARFWRIAAPRGDLCLRCWPAEHPTVARLVQIHHVLLHVYRQGFPIIPVPIRTLEGATFVEQAGHLYELTPWLSGEANFNAHPTESRLQAAMVAAARFHVSAAAVTGVEQKTGFSQGVIERRRQVIALRGGGLRRITAAIAPEKAPSEIATELEPLAREISFLVPTLISRVEAELRECESIPLILQPSIRDLRGEHILFEGDRVTGIVDFGSMRVDSPMGDIARLLGSLVADDTQRRQTGLTAYETVRTLGDHERKVLPIFDRSEVLLSATNWLDWIYYQGRQFDTWQAVLSRIRRLTARLHHLAEQGDFS